MKDYDVFVLGSGLGGSITASALAKKGWRVLLMDAGSHPRFAIGEATTPDISFLMKIAAARFELPELNNLTTFHQLRDNVSSACGIKKAFSFLYQREGEDQLPEESHQFPTLAPPFGPDCHFFRQDTDAYMVKTAVGYGADLKQNIKINEFEFDDDGVTIQSEAGETFTGRFLVDATGFRSPIATKFNLRETPTRLKTKSRALFTHMVGAKHYDDLAPKLKEFGLAYPFAEGTLHHIFDGGWMWVIPFDNHPEHTNPLCSVGLLLDSDQYPKTDMAPEEEWEQFLDRFPKVAEQFKHAKPIRPWVSTGRIQYSASDIVGDRFCMLSHAGGFIDPLFSTGLNLTMSVICDLVPRLDEALTADSFSREKFDTINDNFQRNLDHCDRMVSNAFTSFQNFDLWDAWFRVWVAGNFVGTSLNGNLYLQYRESKDVSFLEKRNEWPFTGVLGSGFEPNRELFESADALMQSFTSGDSTASEAADGIRSLFAEAKYLPSYFKWHDKSVRSTTTFTVPQFARMYFWYSFFAPKEVREKILNCKMTGVIGYTVKSLRVDRAKTKSRKRFLWDTFFAKRKSKANRPKQPT